MLNIPKNHIIYQSNNWIVNHRVDTIYPGYLIVSTTSTKSDLHEIDVLASKKLVCILSFCERFLYKKAFATKVLICKYGFTKDLPFHFHIIPIYTWVIDEIKQDAKYLEIFKSKDQFSGPGVSFYISKQYEQGKVRIPQDVISKAKIIKLLKIEFENYEIFLCKS